MLIPRDRRPTRRGYTLLEMLIVVGIVATMVALGAIMFAIFGGGYAMAYFVRKLWN